MDPEIEIQYDLYLAVYLDDAKKNVFVPDYWCGTFDLASTINNGLNKHQNHLIFFSRDLNKISDFSLHVRTKLDSNIDGCYFGKVTRAFSKRIQMLVSF